ncbi:MAG: C-terminal binding protein [Opitutaceae bacterium]|nr:C-terminal binding protein [Verrucomicrobiales bacterium]
MHKVVITDYLAPPADIEQRELQGLAEVHCLQARRNEELPGKLGNADAVIVFHEITLEANVIAELDCCRVIVRCGVGFDAVDIKAAGARGIPVCNVPDYGVDEVADHAIGLMLACNRGIVRAERTLRHTLAPWDKRAAGSVPRLSEMTMGIVGLGRIGSATALRAKALKMRVIAYDPYLRPGMEKVLGVRMVDWPTLLVESDVVSLHTPLTDETRGFMNARALTQMKPTALLINTSRGAVVDVDALAEALRAGRLAGAGLDVLPGEPPDPDAPIIKLWQDQNGSFVNLVITPHTAFFSDAGMVEMRTKAAQEISRALRGEPLRNCVNLEFLQPPGK